LLYWGGEVLVKYSARLALTLGLSPLLIGLTIVAFGTSSPELLATLFATFQGSPDVAVGNIVGSNITNLGLILGLSALVFPLQVKSKLIRRELPLMILVALALAASGYSLIINRWEGALLFGALVAYLIFLFKNDEKAVDEDEFTQEYGHNRASGWRPIVGIIFGIILLVAGAQSLVTGAIALARDVGISERVIGISLVAVSTSLPELASSLVAALKREGDILIGNLIGSNIFNILGTLGITASLKPVPMSAEIFQFDLWVMVGISVAVLPFLATRLRLERWEGGFLLGLYIAYIVFLYR
jgi:cation:H+ antiporter